MFSSAEILGESTRSAKRSSGRPPENRRVRQQVTEHLREGRLAGTEEAADPDVRQLARLEDRLLVGVKHLLEAFQDVIRCDVLVELEGDGFLVGEIDLDDLLDRAPDRTAKDVLDLHWASLLARLSRNDRGSIAIGGLTAIHEAEAVRADDSPRVEQGDGKMESAA